MYVGKVWHTFHYKVNVLETMRITNLDCLVKLFYCGYLSIVFLLNPSNLSASKINKNITMEKVGDAVVDVESLAQLPDICCSGSPKIPVSFHFA